MAVSLLKTTTEWFTARTECSNGTEINSTIDGRPLSRVSSFKKYRGLYWWKSNLAWSYLYYPGFVTCIDWISFLMTFLAGYIVCLSYWWIILMWFGCLLLLCILNNTLKIFQLEIYCLQFSDYYFNRAGHCCWKALLLYILSSFPLRTKKISAQAKLQYVKLIHSLLSPPACITKFCNSLFLT